MKRKFTEWYSNETKQRLDDEEMLESIEIKFKLSTIKPLHVVDGDVWAHDNCNRQRNLFKKMGKE